MFEQALPKTNYDFRLADRSFLVPHNEDTNRTFDICSRFNTNQPIRLLGFHLDSEMRHLGCHVGVKSARHWIGNRKVILSFWKHNSNNLCAKRQGITTPTTMQTFLERNIFLKMQICQQHLPAPVQSEMHWTILPFLAFTRKHHLFFSEKLCAFL